MKKSVIVISFLILGILFASPVSAEAETKAGIKPGSFFYFFDTTFEKINLFFTFNPEKKAQKNLEYADERLAEAEAVANEKNTDAVKTAVAGYESNMASAAVESRQIKDKSKTEELLNSIADNTQKHQEVLADVLSKVPEEAKEAITKAIEASKKGQEEAMKQVAELKSEVEQLKKEVAELKKKQECDELWGKMPDKRGYDNWGKTSDIVSLYNRAKVLLAQETLWDTDENRKLVKEVFDEARPLYENYVNKCGQPTVPEVKASVPQNPQCLVLKEQIEIQNNKKVEIGLALKKIKGKGDNDSSNICDDKILVSDQISCIQEQIQLRQKLVANYEQQITDIESVIKGLLSDYKKYACSQ